MLVMNEMVAFKCFVRAGVPLSYTEFPQSHLIHFGCAHFDDSFSHFIIVYRSTSIFISNAPKCVARITQRTKSRSTPFCWQFHCSFPLLEREKIIVTCTTESKGFPFFVLQSSSNVKDWRQHDDGSDDVNGNESSFGVPFFFPKVERIIWNANIIKGKKRPKWTTATTAAVSEEDDGNKLQRER